MRSFLILHFDLGSHLSLVGTSGQVDSFVQAVLRKKDLSFLDSSLSLRMTAF